MVLRFLSEQQIGPREKGGEGDAMGQEVRSILIVFLWKTKLSTPKRKDKKDPPHTYRLLNR